MTADAARDIHIPLGPEHIRLAEDLCDVIASHARRAAESFWLGSYPMALHDVAEVRRVLLTLIPLAKRLSEEVLKPAPGSDAA